MSRAKKLGLRRIYDPAGEDEGLLVLVDRLWPRGVKKEAIDFWVRDLAPSNELRRWYDHDEEKWDEFRRRYFAELDDQSGPLQELRDRLSEPATFLFASRAPLNNALALKDYLEGKRP